jgi:hypothetical protein
VCGKQLLTQYGGSNHISSEKQVYTGLEYKGLSIYDTPSTCLGLQWPGAERWLLKGGVLMGNYMKDVQVSN